LGIVYPFKAWIPSDEYVSQVAVRSSGYADNKEILSVLSENPLSYLHAVKPYLHFGTDKKDPSLHFAHGANYIKQMIQSGVLHQHSEETYYIYRQTSIDTGIYYQGIVGLCGVEAFNQDKVKRHEHTLPRKENMLVEHISFTKMSGEPVLVMHDSYHDLEAVKRNITANPPVITFACEGQQHELWIVENEERDLLQEELDKIPMMYIADGHHRSAAAVKYIDMGKSEEKGFMTLFVDKSDLHIEPFHRLVKTDVSKLLEFLNGNNFKVTEVNSYHELEKRIRCFGFYFDNNWHQIEYTGVYFEENALDVSIIEEAFINDYCGIANSKEDNRVEFIEGSQPMYLAENRVANNEFDLLIALNSCRIEDICDIADRNETMPPKSTYVLPKLLSGLTIQEI